MFKHSFLIAFRNLKRHKGSFFINLVGLSTGLACTFLIYLWVTDELNFDKFHKNDKQLYQVLQRSTENGSVVIHDGTQGPLADAMKNDLPEVTKSVSVMSMYKYGMTTPLKWEEKAAKGYGIFAGTEFFNVFSFELLSGKAADVLKKKEAIVLSEKLAVSMFGSPEKAIGKNISWEIIGKKLNSTVTGVFATLPANNSMQFDFIGTTELLYNEVVPNFQKWWNEGPETYLLLKPGTDIAQFDKKIEKFIHRYFPETIFTLFVRRYSSAYLYGKYENGVQVGGRIEYVRMFSIIAIFILVIACINFMNLSTAKASRRLKEIGIKKAIGSTRKALVLQFLSEALFMAMLSLVVAVVIVTVTLPVFNSITGKSLNINFDSKIISLALLTAFITGIFSGSYPAFYMSGFDVVSVFKGKLKKSMGELLARKGLVIFQFMISLVLIVAVMVILKQMDYVQSASLGYDRSNLIHFDKDGNLTSNTEGFLAELRNTPGVLNASAMQEGLIQKGNGSSTYGIDWPGKSEKQLVDIAVRQVDYDLIETLGIDVVAGRSFSKEYGSDNKGLIFNETAIKIMGLKNPIGTKINMWGEEMTIIGVVKDFHITSLHEAISPLVFRLDPSRASVFMVKIEGRKNRETIAEIEKLYSKFNKGYVFQFKFLDEVYQAQYVSEQRVATISKYFAGLAILISCLGLFGLAAFNAEVRTKEIGIRKVLGATVSNVMVLLSKDFLVLIILSMAIAFPLAWLAMKSWLNGFAYRVSIGAEVFVVAGVAMIMLAFITVGYQSLRSALTNPVKSLRSE